MLPRFENAAAAMQRMQVQQERIANNLANASTTGFKGDRYFTRALNERIDFQGNPRSERRLRQGSDFSPGSLKQTGAPLDLALGSEGFFVTRGPGGENRYTRAGSFTLGQEGTLQTPSGRPVLGEGGELRIPPGAEGKVEISESGRVALRQENGETQEVGRLRVAKFDRPQDLERTQKASFRAPDQEPRPAESPEVMQGKLETSNVSPVRQMTEMITHYRQFQAQQKSLTASGEALSSATQSLGQLG